MRQILLTEYQKSQTPIALTTAERDAIAQSIKSITIEPAPGQTGQYFLTPSSTIGALELDNLAIVIRPKIPIDRVLFLISYALDPKHWFDIGFDLDESQSIFESIIPAFVTHVRRAISRGVLQGYRTHEDVLSTVRGQIRFSDQIRNRYGIFPPVEVRFDDFTEDILENQLIKAAINALSRRKIRSPIAQRELRSLESAFQNVSLIPFDRRNIPEVQFTRLNSRYRAAIHLATLILRASSFELNQGKVTATSFLVDMNQVFEDFVVTALRETLDLSRHAFPQNADGRRLLLDEAGRIKLEPDISWWENGRCVFVGDVKYKSIKVQGFKHPDVYQMLSYTIAADVPEGLIIYAKGESAPVVHQILMANKLLTVVSIDLSGSPNIILDQITSLAKHITSQRQQCLASLSSHSLPSAKHTPI